MRTFVTVSTLLFIIIVGLGGYALIAVSNLNLPTLARNMFGDSAIGSLLVDQSEVRGGDWDQAVRTPDGEVFGISSASTLNVRSSASLDADVIGTIYERHPVQIVRRVDGVPVEGDENWYELTDGGYISAVFVEPFVPTPVAATYDGHWIDVNLATSYGVAYDGDDPVYVSILRLGAAGTETPEGEFQIFNRVESETMDSATVGIEEGDPDYYYLEDVPYVQYFYEDGYALHGNDWSEPQEFGSPGSQGCINLMEDDALFFWNFLTNGSPVSVHR